VRVLFKLTVTKTETLNQLTHRKITETEKFQQFKSVSRAREYICLLTYCALMCYQTNWRSRSGAQYFREHQPASTLAVRILWLPFHLPQSASKTVDSELTSYFVDCKDAKE